MNIVVEGPDGSGKSTLVQQLGQHLRSFTIKQGEGPEKYPGEIIERIERYLQMGDRIIFDRHPVISQSIYGRFREGSTKVPGELVEQFYQQRPLIIYVRGRAGSHEIKDYDTPDHIALIDHYRDQIQDAYEAWAFRHANLVFTTQEDDLNTLIQLCLRELNQ